MCQSVCMYIYICISAYMFSVVNITIYKFKYGVNCVACIFLVLHNRYVTYVHLPCKISTPTEGWLEENALHWIVDVGTNPTQFVNK